MIISASARTDIPAFYAPWFVARFRAGFAMVRNPYGGREYRVSLRDGVDGFVFWTRNIRPFSAVLDEIAAAAFPFSVTYTITGAPRALEQAVPTSDDAVAALWDVANRFGARRVVWRYDPVLISTLTPPDWHRENFAGLAAALRGAVDEVTASFAQIYRKTQRNLDAAAGLHGFSWRDPDIAEKRALIGDLAAIAGDNGMALSVCSQPDLVVPGSVAATCIDGARLSDIAGRPLSWRKKGTRAACDCAESRDIGAYDSCPHGCAYCYAVSRRDRAKAFFQGHDPDAEQLC